jgi:hypothetical protein
MDTVMRPLLVRLASLQVGVFQAEHSQNWQGGWIHGASPV